MLLRFLDTEAGEQQISIRYESTDFDVSVHRLAPGQTSVWDRLSRLPKSEMTPVEAARLLEVQRISKRIQRSSQLGELLQAGAQYEVSFAPSNVIFLEGTRFGLSLRSAAKDVSVEFLRTASGRSVEQSRL